MVGRRIVGPAHLLCVSIALLACLSVSCRSIPPLPPADLSNPGWQIQQGQAVWRPTKNRPELAGEILLATNSAGGFFAQFSKTPFTLATAQVMDGTWQIEFGAGEHVWRGRGEPPARFVWFQLPRAFAGKSLSQHWKFNQAETNFWRFESRRTGETLEGSFAP